MYKKQNIYIIIAIFNLDEGVIKIVNISERTKQLGTENAFTVLAEVKKRLAKGDNIKNFK